MGPSRTRPRVSVRSLGGTVAMTSPASEPGARPTIGAQGLVAAVPRLGDVAVVDAASLCAVPSASLEVHQVLECLASAEQACLQGSVGVVVTMGTDTLEETAFLFDLLWAEPHPLVVTGAMRPADATGADGPANLLAAVTVAADRQSQGRGCLVVMNDEVHAARHVRKLHTSSPAAFGSPGTGPLGRVQEHAVRYDHAPRERRPVRLNALGSPPQVGLVRLGIGADTALLECAVRSYDGVVVESFGGGHVPTWWVEPLLTAARRLPLVLASRTGSGALLTGTYDFDGSEGQLLSGGMLSAGSLDGLKARVLLMVALMVCTDKESLPATFARLAEVPTLSAGQNA